ncbi:MAG: hypothetical protein L0271_20355 [Gemmatimonadetes bacterium]|nr:hypothetical protein [Gemmatimonadota bacterium]
MSDTTSRAFLRHTVATLAYRGGKALRDAPPGFESFRAGSTSRSAGEILAHIGDLLDWAVTMADGRQAWNDSASIPWADGVERFFDGLARLEARLADPQPLGYPEETLFQGPIADALTHTGQIAMLRRLADAPVRGENYARADILAGRVGREQSTPRREFD